MTLNSRWDSILGTLLFVALVAAGVSCKGLLSVTATGGSAISGSTPTPSPTPTLCYPSGAPCTSSAECCGAATGETGACVLATAPAEGMVCR